MATFKFSGDYDKVSAELKKTLEAREASFQASLQALFKPTPSPSAKPTAQPSAPPSTRDWAQKADRRPPTKSDDNDTVRGRLRTTIRSR